MPSMTPSVPWFRAACYALLAGCASTDSATEGRPDPGVPFVPNGETVTQELPDPPDPSRPRLPCGECSLYCAPSQRCVAAVCTPSSDGVARLIAPQSFGRLTTQRPTFRWVLPANVTGGRFQICSDRPCRTVLRSVDLVGQSFRPEEPLAPGLYFWRVQSRRGTFVSQKPTPIWEFVVGARETGTDAVLGRITDFNGDGYTDLALGFGDVRPIGIYLGSPTGLALSPAERITPPSLGGVRGPLTPVGDLDGDGFLDLLSVLTAPGDPRQRLVFLYRTGPSGVGAPREIPLPAGVERWPERFGGAGDLNDDGYGDLVAVDHERGAGLARLRVYFGAAEGVQPAPEALLLGEAGDGLGSSISNSDFNGDGRPDLLVGAPLGGYALAWVNRPGGCFRPEVTRLWGDDAPGSLFGQDLTSVADFNGDGYGDPLVTEPYTAAVQSRSRLVNFQGNRTGVSTAPRAMPLQYSQIEDIRPRAGDFNGDGYSDAAVWMHNEGRGPSIHLFDGGPDGLPNQARRVIFPADLGSIYTGLSFASPGDANRDGYEDLVLSLLPTEWIYIRGSATGLQIVDGPRLELP